MHDPISQNWTLSLTGMDAIATGELALSLRTDLGAGDVVLLEGPIGAGKSHFARVLIQALLNDAGLHEDIPSPTFTLVQTYQAGELEIWHSDLYRLSLVDEVDELGLLEAFDTALCLVEWPDRLQDEAPKSALTIRFSIALDADLRDIEVSATHPKWDWVRTLLERQKT